ncbi:MAG: acyl-CoA dehydrogenase family protein [Sphingobium sp.]
MQSAAEELDLRFSDEQDMLIEVADEFAREWSGFEAMRALVDSADGFNPDAWRAMVGLGWPATLIPEQFGGSGLTVSELVPVAEALGRRLMASPLVPTVLATLAIRAGSDAQQAAWLPSLAQGGIGTIALREPGREWLMAEPALEATETSDGFRLTGQKTDVAFAAAADLIIVSARLRGTPRLFLVERSCFSGDALRPQPALDQTQRVANLAFDGLLLPDTALLAGESGGVDQLARAATLLSAAEMCGGAAGCIELTLDYLKMRHAFGRPIGAFQALKHPMADMFAHKEMARSLLYGASSQWPTDKGWQLARMASAKLADLFPHIADRAIQFHGGIGFTYECNAAPFLRRAIWLRAQYGDGPFFRRSLADELLA